MVEQPTVRASQGDQQSDNTPQSGVLRISKDPAPESKNNLISTRYAEGVRLGDIYSPLQFRGNSNYEQRIVSRSGVFDES